MNFTERATDARTMFRPEAYERLQAVKAACDPDGRMRGNHHIPAAD
jgi:FAD/FMN-containing dehydrogenase